mgnify:CR=1 FL=1
MAKSKKAEEGALVPMPKNLVRATPDELAAVVHSKFGPRVQKEITVDEVKAVVGRIRWENARPSRPVPHLAVSRLRFKGVKKLAGQDPAPIDYDQTLPSLTPVNKNPNVTLAQQTYTKWITIAGVAAGDAGAYSVVVSNAAGSVTSSAGTLSVLPLDTLERAFAEICRYAQVRNRTELPFRLGTMIEVPSAAFMIEELLPRVDSISVGLNDLTQYFLAADRDDETIERYHDPMQPALLRLLKQIIDAAARQKKPVTICGELAGDPNLTALLLALGVRRFSVSRSNYRRAVELIRSLSCQDLESLAVDVLKMVSGDAVRTYVAERFAARH